MGKFGTYSWVILDSLEQRIKEKVEKLGVPLGDWDIRINYGIKTGFNGPLDKGGCFIITQGKRDELIEKCPKAVDIIRPILRGRDIEKYKANWANLYIIHVPWHFPLHKDSSITGSSIEAEKAFSKQYPAIYNHLLEYKTQLNERNQAETGIRYEWYALQRWGANYMDDFFVPKIIWGEISDTSKFAYDENNFFVEATSFLLTGKKLKYLLGMLNSKLLEWYFNQIGTATGVGTNRWKKYTIELLPIKEPTESEERKLLDLIDKVLKSSTDIDGALLEKIDHLVYRLYNLNEEEISFISKVNISQ